MEILKVPDHAPAYEEMRGARALRNRDGLIEELEREAPEWGTFVASDEAQAPIGFDYRTPPLPPTEPVKEEGDVAPDEVIPAVVVPFIGGPASEVYEPQAVEVKAPPTPHPAPERVHAEGDLIMVEEAIAVEREHQELEARGLAVGCSVVHSMWDKGIVMGWEAGYVWAHFGQDRCLRRFFDGYGLIRDTAADGCAPVEEMALAGVGA